jgi:succinate dehydrogenase hydrophobic anchor subunit
MKDKMKIESVFTRLNPVLWILKVVTGIGLFVLLGMHFYSLHLHSEPLFYPASAYYWIFLAFVSIHVIIALRDMLIEAGLKRLPRLLVLILLIVLFLVPPILGENTFYKIRSSLEEPEGDNCVENPIWMRYNHKSYLLQWRDSVVRAGVRYTIEKTDIDRKSIEGCFDCHSYENFCKKCHDFAGVKPDCFSCHSASGET